MDILHVVLNEVNGHISMGPKKIFIFIFGSPKKKILWKGK